MHFELTLHIPVLAKEVLQYLNPKPNENFIDCTIGEAGHTISILERIGPNGKVLGIDLDAGQIERSAKNTAGFGNRVVLANDSYANLKEIVEENNFKPVNGIILDLGMSSVHLEESGRGFSFLRDEPLDMRYNAEIPNSKIQISNLTAEKIINEYPREKLEEIFREYGEEKFARKIADAVAEKRRVKRIKRSLELAEIIRKAIPARYHFGRIHFATRVFQALRIAVNGEIDNLSKFLSQAVEILDNEGRLAIISFHSIEDRIVKNFFRRKVGEGTIELLNKKPVVASHAEIKTNNRSRSAKLRAIIKIIKN